MRKKAVLLINLGSPKSPSIKDVRAYLDQFLNDPRVMDYPYLIRKLVVDCFIMPFRPKRSAAAYKKIWQPEGSPLIITSKALQEKIAKESGLVTELCMTYGSPSVEEAVKSFVYQDIEEVFIIPLFPHYAKSSYETAVVAVLEGLKKYAPDVRFEILQPYYNDPLYIQALAESMQPYLKDPYDKLLFSFHGIPERHLKTSDPSKAHCCKVKNCCEQKFPSHATCYRHQCLETVKAIVHHLNIPKDKYSVSFQSRLGTEKWLEPYTDATIAKLARDGVKRLLVVCPAFVADCLETIEEIAAEGKEIFLHAGGDSFFQIPCLNLHQKWVEFLLEKIEEYADKTIC